MDTFLRRKKKEYQNCPRIELKSNNVTLQNPTNPKMKHRKTIVTIFTIIAIVFLLPQLRSQSILNKCDTVNIIAPAFLVLNDTSIHLHSDTTAIICEKYIVLTQKNGYNL